LPKYSFPVSLFPVATRASMITSAVTESLA
jgi:hypothetical protein